MNTKPPVGFYGKTGTGALTGLSAVGGQEPYLYCKKKRLQTDYKHKEYTEGNTFYKVYRPVQDTYLGSEIRHKFLPKEMGDILTSLMVSFELPGANGYGVEGLYNHGYSIIEKASLLINGEEIQTLDGNFMGIYESMYSSEVDRNNTLNFMVNMNYGYDTKPIYPVGDQKQRCLVPLPFFFNNHYVDSCMDTNSYRSSLPLCALYNSEITLVIRFKRLEQIVEETGKLNGTDLTDLKFITEETVLSSAERNEMRNKVIRFPIEKINKEDFEFVYKIQVSPTQFIYQYFFTYYLNSIYSARAIMFFFKEKTSGFAPDYYTPITNATLNTLTKTDRGEARDKKYFQEYQAYSHGYHCNGLFYMFSFSELPLQVILGDYEFRAPKPQSAYLFINFYPESPDSYVYWTDVFDPLVQSDYILTRNLYLNTSVGLGTDGFLNSIVALNAGFLRTDQASVGIPGVSYENTNTGYPYNLRFNPYKYKYTRSGVDYFVYENPAPTYYDEFTGTIRIDQSFTYDDETIAVSAWSNSPTNSQALILIKKNVGPPEWGTYSGDVYSLTDNQLITVTPLPGTTWTSGKYYPTDDGLLDVDGFLLIIGNSRAQINAESKDVSIYIISFYYFSTAELICKNGKIELNTNGNSGKEKEQEQEQEIALEEEIIEEEDSQTESSSLRRRHTHKHAHPRFSIKNHDDNKNIILQTNHRHRHPKPGHHR